MDWTFQAQVETARKHFARWSRWHLWDFCFFKLALTLWKVFILCLQRCFNAEAWGWTYCIPPHKAGPHKCFLGDRIAKENIPILFCSYAGYCKLFEPKFIGSCIKCSCFNNNGGYNVGLDHQHYKTAWMIIEHFAVREKQQCLRYCYNW